MSEFKSYSMSFYRQINLLSAEETKKYYDLVINSKRWLFYETRDNNCSNENLHKNSFGDRNLESKTFKIYFNSFNKRRVKFLLFIATQIFQFKLWAWTKRTIRKQNRVGNRDIAKKSLVNCKFGEWFLTSLPVRCDTLTLHPTPDTKTFLRCTQQCNRKITKRANFLSTPEKANKQRIEKVLKVDF